MKKHSFVLSEKISVSLSSILESQKQNQKPIAVARATGFVSDIQTPTLAQDLVAVSLKVNDHSSFEASLPALADEERLESISNEFYSGQLRVATLQQLVENPHVERVETKKSHTLASDKAATDIGIVAIEGNRPIAETGKNVFIGIVDSGFDLSHPMFRDKDGNLRVTALLDQTQGNREYNTATLESEWVAGGSRPGNLRSCT